MVNNALIRRFLREINQYVPGKGKQKRQILRQVKTSILEYLAETPNTTYDDLLVRFGTPDQIAAAYLEEMDLSDLKKHLTVRKRIVCAAIAVAIVVVGIWAGVVTHALWKYNKSANGYFKIVVTEDFGASDENGGT